MRYLSLFTLICACTLLPLRGQDDTAQSLLDSGDAKLAKQDFHGAVLDYTQSLALQPNNPLAYSQRCLAYIGDRDLDQAVADATQAINLYPGYAEAYHNRGLAQASRQDFQDAISDYTLALKYDPQDASSYFKRAEAKTSLADPDGAMADYNETLKLRPNDATVYEGRGELKVIQKDYDGALADFNQAITLDPKYSSAYFARARVKRLLKDDQGADLDIKTVAAWMPSDNQPKREYIQQFSPVTLMAHAMFPDTPHPKKEKPVLPLASTLPPPPTPTFIFGDLLARIATLLIILCFATVIRGPIWR